MENWEVFQDHINTVYNKYLIPESYKDNVPCEESLSGLQIHQAMLANYTQDNARLNKFNGLLIFHGMGSGKTCTSIAIAEGLKATDIDENELYYDEPFRSENNIIITTPAQVVPQFKNEILEGCSKYLKINGKAQYYGDLTINEEIENINNLINTHAKNIYSEEENLRETSNDAAKRELRKKITKLDSTISRLSKEKEELRNLLESKINNTYTLFSHDKFIDSLLKEENDNFIPGKLLKKIKKNPNSVIIIDEIQNLISEPKPVYSGRNSGKKYLRLLSAIREFPPTVRIYILTGTPIYDNPHQIGLILNLLRPSIPFPLSKKEFDEVFVKTDIKTGKIIKYPILNKKNKVLFERMVAGYVSYLKGSHPYSYPKIIQHNVNGKMNEIQLEGYVSSINSEIKRDTLNKIFDDSVIVEEERSDKKLFNKTRAYSNIYLPPLMTSEHLFDELTSGNFFEVLAQYSIKFTLLLKKIRKSKGPIFIYTQYLNEPTGAMMIAKLLDILGYRNFNYSFYEPKYDLQRYIIWSGDTKGGKYKLKGENDNDFKQRLLKVFNDPKNKYGKQIKIIIGTKAVKAGLDLKNVREVHLMDPWWNHSEMQQIIYRAVRFCSHKNLPLKERIVDVYNYSAVLPGEIDEIKWKKFQDMSIDQFMYKLTKRKERLNYEFNEMLKSTSIDCQLNKNANIKRKKDENKETNILESEPFDCIKKLPNIYWFLQEIDNTIVHIPVKIGNDSIPKIIVNNALKVQLIDILSKKSSKELLTCIKQNKLSYANFISELKREGKTRAKKLIDKTFDSQVWQIHRETLANNEKTDVSSLRGIITEMNEKQIKRFIEKYKIFKVK